MVTLFSQTDLFNKTKSKFTNMLNIHTVDLVFKQIGSFTDEFVHAILNVQNIYFTKYM